LIEKNGLFKHYVLNYLNKNVDLDIDEIKSNLSGNEALVYEYLINNLGEVVSKEDIAYVLWKDEWEDKFSEWAIDKLISRIRKKIKDVEGAKEIKTIKGKGYTLLN